jgi:hypothetical protein
MKKVNAIDRLVTGTIHVLLDYMYQEETAIGMTAL